MITERNQYTLGYRHGQSLERERLYVTIDRLLIKASHDDAIKQEEFKIIEKTLLLVKNSYMLLQEK